MDEQTAGKATNKLMRIVAELYKGYPVYSREEFSRRLFEEQWQIIELANDCYALVEFLTTADGYSMHVITCCGNFEGSERAMEDIERFARKSGAVCVIGLARYGWKPMLEKLNYECGSKLTYFRKII
jgi:hypothetical protein